MNYSVCQVHPAGSFDVEHKSLVDCEVTVDGFEMEELDAPCRFFRCGT